MEKNAIAVNLGTNSKEFSKKSRRGRNKKQGTYKCEFCGKNFQKPNCLAVHRRCHTGERPYVCDICGKRFIQSCNLASHKIQHTRAKASSYCKICEKGYSSAYSLAVHNLVHSGEKPHECDICGQKFRQKCHVQKHKIKIHSRPEKSKPKSKSSRKKEATSVGKKQHLSLRKLDQNENKLGQLLCGTKNPIPEKKDTISHHQKQYKLNPISRKCKKINEKIQDQSSHGKVNQHSSICAISDNSDTLAKSEVDNLSEISMKSKSLVQDTGNSQEHSLKNSEEPDNSEQIVGKPAGTPNQCDVCGKVFKQNSYVKIHKRTHTLEKPYFCETCGNKYRYIHHLRYHLKKGNCSGSAELDLTLGQPRYMCYYCDKVYNNLSILEVHQRSHEKILAENSQLQGKKPYKCQFCSKTFRNTSHKIVHERVHTGQRPFQCDQCSKAFKQISHLLGHQERIHTKERVANSKCKLDSIQKQKNLNTSGSQPKHAKVNSVTKKTRHKCEFCSKSFKLLNQLQLHKRMHERKLGPFRCQICSKEFKRLGNLCRHELVHTGAKPYICELCGSACTLKSDLEVHVRKVHKGPNLVKKSGKLQRVTTRPTSKVRGFRIEKGSSFEKSSEESSDNTLKGYEESEAISNSVTKYTKESNFNNSTSKVYAETNLLTNSSKIQSEAVFAKGNETLQCSMNSFGDPNTSNACKESHVLGNSSELQSQTLCSAGQVQRVEEDVHCTKNSTEVFQFHKSKGRNLLAELKKMRWEKMNSTAQFHKRPSILKLDKKTSGLDFNGNEEKLDQSNLEMQSCTSNTENDNSKNPLLIKKSAESHLKGNNLKNSEYLSNEIKTKANPNSFSSCKKISTKAGKGNIEIRASENSSAKVFEENQLNEEAKEDDEQTFVCCECGGKFEGESSMMKHCVEVH